MLRKHGIRLKGDGHVRWFHETDGVACGPDENATFDRGKTGRALRQFRAFETRVELKGCINLRIVHTLH